LIPLLVTSLERHGHLQLDEKVREKILRISASSIDRLLAPARAGSKKRRKRPPAVRGKIPIRTFADWDDPLLGFMEIDLVAHCGGSVSGRFNHTLTLTDIHSGWTECVALAVRDSSLVVRALECLRGTMPFPLLGIDSDNGGEFVNDVLLRFTQEHEIEFTRSRPYRKNDQAWVEQKNGAVVRRMVGYGRMEGSAAAEALERLYGSIRLFVNSTDTAGTAQSYDVRMCCSGNAVYVFWLDERNGGSDIYFNRSIDNGATWLTDDRRVNDSAGTSFKSSFSLCCEGSNLYVAWNDDRNGESDIYFNHSADGGLSWRPGVEPAMRSSA